MLKQDLALKKKTEEKFCLKRMLHGRPFVKHDSFVNLLKEFEVMFRGKDLYKSDMG